MAIAATLVKRFCFPTTALSGLPTMQEYGSYFRNGDEQTGELAEAKQPLPRS